MEPIQCALKDLSEIMMRIGMFAKRHMVHHRKDAMKPRTVAGKIVRQSSSPLLGDAE